MPVTKTEIDILLRAKADLAAFKTAKSEVAGIRGELTKSNTAFKEFGATARTAIGALGVGVSAGAVISKVREGIRYGAQIVELSKQADISTTAFQALAINVRDADVSQQELAGTLSFLKKSISEANAGIGESQKAFKALGLDARALAKLPTEQALELIARATGNADNEATAYAYTLKILGEGSKKLTQLLKDLGEKGFNAVAEQSKGQILTPEELVKLKQAEQAFEELDARLTIAGAKLAIYWSNFLRIVNDGAWYEKLTAGGRAFQQTFFAAEKGAVDATKATDDFTAALGDAKDAVTELKLTEEELALTRQAFAEGEAFIARLLVEHDQARVAAAKETLSLHERAARLGEKQDQFALDALHPLDRAVELKERLIALETQQAEVTGDTNAAFAKRLDYEEKILELRIELSRLAPNVEGSLDLFFGNIDAASSSMGDLGDETKKMGRAAREMQRAIQDAFDSGISGGQKFGDVLRDLARNILSILIHDQISVPAAAGITDFFKGLFGGFRASGGEVEVGKFYKVGEKGTELFAPGMSGTIIPNHAIAASAGDAGGGDTIIINHHYGEGVSRGELAGIIPQIVSASKNAVLDAKRRGQPGFA
jgi:hypothetical protein